MKKSKFLCASCVVFACHFDARDAVISSGSITAYSEKVAIIRLRAWRCPPDKLPAYSSNLSSSLIFIEDNFSLK